MAVPNLRLVDAPIQDAPIPDPPYPADTATKGWKFILDIPRIKRSDTWVRTPREMRPWLIMTWMAAWEQIPTGSLPDDPASVAGHIDIDAEIFAANSDILLRGFVRYSDGRIYHPVIVDQAFDMLVEKTRESKRKAAYRAAQRKAKEMHKTETCPPHVPPQSPACPAHNAGDMQACPTTVPIPSASGTGTGTGTKEKTQEDRRPLAVDPPPPPPKKAEKPKKPRTPYQDILDLYREMLPMCEQPLGVDHWTDARKATIRARWQKQMPDLDAWRECFGYVAASRFLTGRAKTSAGRKPFRASLFWIAKEENLLKIYEGKYDN